MLNSYSPRDVNVSFNSIAITGFAQDSFIRIRRNSDLLTETVGSAGELALTHVADKTGEIEIELMQTSESNLLLSGLVASMEVQGALIPVGAIVIQDPSGSNLTVAQNAYIKGLPEIDLGSDQNTRTWVFGCERLDYTDTPDGLIPDITGFTI